MMFQHPWAFSLVLIVIPVLLLLLWMRRKKPAIKFSDLSLFKDVSSKMPRRWRIVLTLFKLVVIALFVVALAQPREGLEETKIRKETIDIYLVIDVSNSMRAEDFKIKGKRVNRLTAVKDVVQQFIAKRTDDRMGIVIFAQQPYTLCPLTMDHHVLLEFLDRAEIGVIESEQTAIGSALTTALRKLKDSTSKSKVIILLTDGANNAGKVQPEDAADIARSLGIRVYTIGAGSKGTAPYPMQDILGNTVYRHVPSDLDETLLKKVATLTGGQYFRATDTQELITIYNEIDQLEKTEVEINQYMQYRELFYIPLLLLFAVLLCEIVLRQTRFRTIP